MKMYNYSDKFEVDKSDGGFSDDLKNNKGLKHQIKKFFDAIKSVPKSYYIFELEENTKNSTETPLIVDKHGLFSHVEHVFAYELYHRWSCRFSGNKDGWIINGEVGKYLKWFYTNKYDDNGKQKYPDLVLHKGQDNNDGHMIVCEIKRKDMVNQGIAEDLNKLCRFTCEQDYKPGWSFTPYHCGIYLIINTDKDAHPITVDKECVSDIIIRNLICKDKFLKLYSVSISDEAKKILCVYSHWDSGGNYSLSYQSLYNILDSDEFLSHFGDNNVIVREESVVKTDVTYAD